MPPSTSKVAPSAENARKSGAASGNCSSGRARSNCPRGRFQGIGDKADVGSTERDQQAFVASPKMELAGGGWTGRGGNCLGLSGTRS